MSQLTSEDMAGSSCGVARDQRLREKDGDKTKSQDSHHKLYKVGVRCKHMIRVGNNEFGEVYIPGNFSRPLAWVLTSLLLS